MKTFTETDLLSFGNYLLSDERKENVRLEDIKYVWHSDIENWKESIKPKASIKIDMAKIEQIVEKVEESIKDLFETIKKSIK